MRNLRHSARPANGCKDYLDTHLTPAEFDTASTLGDDLAPFFIDRGAHPRLQPSPPYLVAGESPAH